MEANRPDVVTSPEPDAPRVRGAAVLGNRRGDRRTMRDALAVQGELPFGLAAASQDRPAPAVAGGGRHRLHPTRRSQTVAVTNGSITPSPHDGADHASHSQLLLTPEQVAEALAIGRTRVYELMASGALPSIRLGRSRRVARHALVRFVAELAGEDHLE